ncbi:MAG: alpha-N-methyltransferase NTM1 [Monoraphidium minutum]|nr:MAG: alpha-N-methyltransferase NTM1 [Monoraphidium minutum]
MDAPGRDAEGKDLYARPDELWERAKGDDGSHEGWYKGAVDYWDKQEASYNGVLGGFGHVSPYDIADSREMLKEVFKAHLKAAADGKRRLTAVDCGAGVGRVTQELLLRHFQTVDLLEPSRHLLQKAQRNLKLAVAGCNYPEGHAPGEFLCCGLQGFEPPAGKYDCIWIQWCLLYLTDADALALFERCKTGLSQDGVIVVKENICKEGFVVDKEDNSLTRSHAYMLELFESAGLQVLHAAVQRNFPKELFEVRQYALRPRGAR